MKRIFHSRGVQNFIAFICFLYVWGVYKVTRWERKGFDVPDSYVLKKKPFITCFWHERLMMLPFAWPLKGRRPFYMLISGHRDGRLISKIVSYFGIQTIAGSSSYDGTIALRHMVRILKGAGTVGVTPDGPKGPRQKVKMGMIMAAYFSQADIIPVTFSVSSFKIFPSWDRFLWAFPSKRGILIWGNPISAPQDKDPHTLERTRVAVEEEMIRLINYADTFVHSA